MNRLACCLLFTFASTVLLPISSYGGQQIYVSPDGNDAAIGSKDSPIASLQRARDLIRQRRADGTQDQAIEVIVADGHYSLTAPLELTSADSGRPDAPVIYRAAAEARPVFSGGKAIKGWVKQPSGVWKTRVPTVDGKPWRFEQLFVNGKRATRARTPNKGTMYMRGVVEIAADDRPTRRANQAEQIVSMREADFNVLSQVPAEELSNVQAVIYHKWDNTRRFIDSIDANERAFVTSGQGMKSWNNWHRGTRYILENFHAALDQPGEWFLDSAGWLSYLPLPGEDMSSAEIVAPVVDQFIVISGDAGKDQRVEHVRFEGLNFEHAAWLTPVGGFEAAQAAAPIDAVVMVDGGRDIEFRDCQFAHFGRYGVWFREGCDTCRVVHCYLHDFGAGGIRIGDVRIPQDDALRTHDILIDNNIIRDGGSIFPCAVGVWVGHSGNNVIRHNEIANLFYSGLSIGWRWGYGESLAKNNLIENNHVHHIGWGLLSDMGGIYTLGPSEGTRVIGNVFHDILAYSYGGWGLYTDEGSSDIVFENNLVYRSKTGGFHQHYGRDNIIRNNILAFAREHQLQLSRSEPHRSFTFENNIVIFDNDELLHGRWKEADTVTRNNLYFNTAGTPIRFFENSLEQWQAQGHEVGSIIADPLFEAPHEDNFRLSDQSPAVKIGFRPFDSSIAGVYGDPAWIELANRVEYPPFDPIPDVPPMAVLEDFENTPVGRTPTGGELHVEGTGDALIVTDKTAAEGKRSLCLQDAKGLKQTYNPHYVYRGFDFQNQVVANTFSLKVEPATYLHFEWRDYQSKPPYVVGPRLTIKDSKLMVPSSGSVDMPIDQWIRFELKVDMRPEVEPTWQLKVTGPDGRTRIWDDLPMDVPGFRRVNWVGMTSNAVVETRCYLDAFELKP